MLYSLIPSQVYTVHTLNHSTIWCELIGDGRPGHALLLILRSFYIITIIIVYHDLFCSDSSSNILQWPICCITFWFCVTTVRLTMHGSPDVKTLSCNAIHLTCFSIMLRKLLNVLLKTFDVRSMSLPGWAGRKELLHILWNICRYTMMSMLSVSHSLEALVTNGSGVWLVNTNIVSSQHDV